MKILIADDDRTSLTLLRMLLERSGHEVMCAEDGAHAWELLQQHQCGVVISDWMMPVMDGIELVKRILAQTAASYHYVILLTSRSESADINLGMAAGADDFLVKPVFSDDLMARLRVAERIVSLQQELVLRNRDLNRLNERMLHDLNAAARVQESLLPTKLPEIAGLSFAWLAKPCEELAGDTLNLFRLDEHHLAFYLLDVSGHGVSSALLAVQVSRLLTPLLSAGSLLKQAIPEPPRYRLVPPLGVIEELNELFPMPEQTLQYFTILYGTVNLHTFQLRLAGAGHTGPLIIHADGSAEPLPFSSNPIGFFPNGEAVFAEHERTLLPGDRLYLYSDGVIETVNRDNQIFDAGCLTPALRAARGTPLKASLETVMAALDAWRDHAPPADDVSMLAIERLA